MGGDLEVDCLGFDQFEGFLAEEAGVRYSSTSGGAGTMAAEGCRRIGADGYGYLHAVFADTFLRLSSH